MTSSTPRWDMVISADGTAVGFCTLGSGDPLIVVGGSMREAEDYLPLAGALASQFTVHVMERRGRGSSGPQGTHYTIAAECADVLAVQARTGASRAFGHSYGGLVLLETARRAPVFTRLALYEAGISVSGNIPTAWMPRYRELLSAGKTRAAFAHFVQLSGHAPGPVERLPSWYLRAVLRLVVRRRQWQRMEPLLATNLFEHEQVHALDDTVTGYGAIDATVLHLAGSRSPATITMRSVDALHRVLPSSTVEVLDGLDHNAPDEKAPGRVGERLRTFFTEPDVRPALR